MSKNEGYLSFGALWGEPITVERLKISTLLYKKIHFEIGYNRNDFVASIIDIYGGQEAVGSKEKDALSKIWISNKDRKEEYSIYGEKDKWPWTYAPNELIEATKATFKQQFNTEDASTEEHYELHKLGGYCMSDILYWQKHFSKTTLICDSLTSKIVTNLSLSNQPADSSIKQQAFDCPSIFKLGWKDILDLRQSPFLKAFRKKYQDLTVDGQTDILLEHYYNALVKLSDLVRPNPSKEVFKAILTNLPIPVINPLGIASSGQDVYKATKIKNDFGWLFFVTDAIKLANNSDSPHE